MGDGLVCGHKVPTKKERGKDGGYFKGYGDGARDALKAIVDEMMVHKEVLKAQGDVGVVILFLALMVETLDGFMKNGAEMADPSVFTTCVGELARQTFIDDAIGLLDKE